MVEGENTMADKDTQGTQDTQRTPRRVSDVLKPKPFYPDLERQPKDQMVDVDVILYDWIIIKDWQSSEFGSSSFAIVAYGSTESNEPQYTSIISGVVILKKLAELSRKGYKGVIARLTKKETKTGNEVWDFS